MPGTQRNPFPFILFVWSLWYALMFTFDGIQSYQWIQYLIWGGAGIAFITFVPTFAQSLSWYKFSSESKLLGFFFIWSLLGFAVATDMDLFLRYARLVLQFMLIVIAVGFLIECSGMITPLLTAFIAAAVFKVFMTLSGLDMTAYEALETHERDNMANATGFRAVMGIFAVLALMAETRRLTIRIALLGLGAVCVYGVVLSSSRGAMVGVTVIVATWSVLCAPVILKGRLLIFPFLLALVTVVWWIFYDWILDNTNLGRRLETMQGFEDHSTQFRYQLMATGISLFLENPITGVGLGQFGIASGTGYIAHNEFAELLGTTGLIGAAAVYLSYFFTWCRLWSIRKVISDHRSLYRINIALCGLFMIVVCGVLFRTNFLNQDSMFFYGLIVGISLWGRRILNRPSTKAFQADQSASSTYFEASRSYQ
jgi:O-antigen ligase